MTTVKNRPSREHLMSNKPIEIEKSIYKDVINNVANQFELSTKKLLSKDRYRNQVLARNMAYYILHGLNTFVNDIEVIPFYMEKYEKVMDTLFEPSNIYSLQ